jgi:hypothetical protein
MLPQQYRDVLIQTMLAAIPGAQDRKNFVNAVRPGSWDEFVTLDATHANAVQQIVEAADGQNWLRDLARRLVTDFPARSEFSTVLVEIDRAAPIQTVADPFDEVLLEGDRPFVNRTPLRAQMKNLIAPGGVTMLLVDGEPKTGKTYSFYYINHVASTRAFRVSKFNMSRLPKPNELAEEILGRIGAGRVLPPQGTESTERWAEKLADIVANAIEEKNTRRLFVFDEFPRKLPDGTFEYTPLPEGTASFIIRLATYADEELRPLLRLVLMRFRDPLRQELDDIALRENVQPFTTTDMVAVVMQVAKARNWDVTEKTVKERVDKHDLTPGRTLNDRFKFLRGLLQELAGASP